MKALNLLRTKPFELIAQLGCLPERGRISAAIRRRSKLGRLAGVHARKLADSVYAGPR